MPFRQPTDQVDEFEGAPPAAAPRPFRRPQDRVADAQHGDRRLSLDNLGRAFARGVPILGAFADEASAATNAALAPFVEPVMRGLEQRGVPTGYDERYRLDDKGGYSERYRAAHDMQTRDDRAFDKAHPKVSIGAQVAGGVASGVGAARMAPGIVAPLTTRLAPGSGLVARSVAAGIEGAGIGATHGYGLGEGGVTDKSRLGTATTGAVLGGAFGLAAPAVGDMIGAGINWGRDTIANWRGGPRPAVGVMPPAQPGDDVAEALMRRSAASDAGVPAAPTDDVVAAIAARRPEAPVVSRPGDANNAYAHIARAAVRQEQTPEALAAAVQGTGPLGVLADSGEAMGDLLRQTVNRPGAASGIARRALDARQKGVMVDGDWVAPPSSTRILDTAADGLGVAGRSYHAEMPALLEARRAAAGPAYRLAYEAPPVPVEQFEAYAQSPAWRAAYDRARAISQHELVSAPGVEGRVVMPLPEEVPSHLDWRTLDLMKQGMDDMVSDGGRGLLQGIGANANNAVRGFRNAFRDTLDVLNPNYAAAREAFAGPTAMMDALEAGRGLLREDGAVVASHMADLNGAERDMARLGAWQALKDKLGNADVTNDAARLTGLLKPNQLERFRVLFPTRQSYGEFVNNLTREQRMFQTRSTAFGNSTTAKQLAHAGQEEPGMMEQIIGAGVSAKTGGLGSVIQAVRNWGRPSMNEPTSETLAHILANTDQNQMPAVIDEVARAMVANSRAQRLNIAGRAAGEAGVAGVGRPREP